MNFYPDSLDMLKKQKVFSICAFTPPKNPSSGSETGIDRYYLESLKDRFLSPIPRDFDSVGQGRYPEILCFNEPLRRF